MTTIILGAALVASTAAAVTLGLKARGYKQLVEELEVDYDRAIDKYTNVFLEVNHLRQALAKLKRKPRKDKGQPRTSYNGKPVTRKRKSDEGK